MTPNEYKARVEHNNEIMQRAVREGHRLNWVVDKIYTWDTEPNTSRHMIEILRNIDDIYPALVLGHLPILDTNGADGIRLDNDTTFVEVEYKHSIINADHISVGKKGGLRYVTGNFTNSPTGITSKISARYVIHNNVESKARDTYFLITDRDRPEWTLVDIRMLSADKIVPLLERSRVITRVITLAQFLNNGYLVDVSDAVTVEGWDNFQDRIRARALDTASVVV